MLGAVRETDFLFTSNQWQQVRMLRQPADQGVVLEREGIVESEGGKRIAVGEGLGRVLSV